MRSHKDRIRIGPLPASATPPATSPAASPATSPAAKRLEAHGRRRAPQDRRSLSEGLRGRRPATGRDRPGSRRYRPPRSRDRAGRRRDSVRRRAGARHRDPAHPPARRRPGGAVRDRRSEPRGRDETRGSRCGQPVEDGEGQDRKGDRRPRAEAQDHQGQDAIGPAFGGDLPEDGHAVLSTRAKARWREKARRPR